jgi:hypothetical protein
MSNMQVALKSMQFIYFTNIIIILQIRKNTPYAKLFHYVEHAFCIIIFLLQTNKDFPKVFCVWKF